jgi:hypothetical protein
MTSNYNINMRMPNLVGIARVEGVRKLAKVSRTRIATSDEIAGTGTCSRIECPGKE